MNAKLNTNKTIMKNLITITEGVIAFAKMERLIALICIFIPLLLFWAEGGTQFRDSISNYVYMDKNPHIFGLLLTLAAMLFIFNGILYIKKGDYLHYSKRHGRWYNIVLGVALLGVVLFPHLEYPVLHYASAILFFVGSAIVIAVFNEKRHRKISIIIAIVSLSSLVVHFINKEWISLLWAEWISLI